MSSLHYFFTFFPTLSPSPSSCCSFQSTTLILICILTISSSCLLIHSIRYQLSLEVQGPHWQLVSVHVCARQKVLWTKEEKPWESRTEHVDRSSAITSQSNVIYFPRNYFNIKRTGLWMEEQYRDPHPNILLFFVSFLFIYSSLIFQFAVSFSVFPGSSLLCSHCACD